MSSRRRDVQIWCDYLFYVEHSKELREDRELYPRLCAFSLTPTLSLMSPASSMNFSIDALGISYFDSTIDDDFGAPVVFDSIHCSLYDQS